MTPLGFLSTRELYENDLEFFHANGPFAGIDEAGRGALAGPVVIAAVVMDYHVNIPGINDSKKLSPATREKLYTKIVASAQAYAIAEIDAAYIDGYNILQATLRGFEQAFFALTPQPPLCLIDGRDVPPGLKIYGKAVIKGDSLFASIAAASILAKVHRDRLMLAYDALYPHYGFARHKGYGTALHCQMIHTCGFSPIHRRTFNVPPASLR